MKKHFDNIKFSSPLILKGDSRLETYQEDTMMRGNAEALLRPKCWQELQEVFIYANAHKIPITFCGSQTSMTGASVAESGLLVSTENLTQVLDVGDGYAVAQPGITISGLKKRVADLGWFYPPAPTSQDDARLGSTISTNATGEDSFQYGSTRKYIRAIKVLMADGSLRVFSRDAGEALPDDSLNRAGYFNQSKNPIDLFIGGEGTLGFIYEVVVDLVELPASFFAALIPFSSWQKAISFVVSVVKDEKFKPRALEYIDQAALSIMQTHEKFPNSLKDANALIYLKQEYEGESELDKKLSQWLFLIEKFSSAKLTEKILLAVTDKQKEEIRLMRHHIPLSINERWRSYRSVGGGKVGSDWWVPVDKLEEMMSFVYVEGEKLGIPFLAFAHLGRGHPHVNYLCKNSEEKKRAEDLLLASCRKAVALGGGVAGEHGIGKLHRNLLPIQWGQDMIDWMVQVKKEYDPNWILGRGNILRV